MASDMPVQPAEGSKTGLAAINAQLIAHGWAKRPLSLDSLAEKDRLEVTNVFHEMLGSCVSNLANFESLNARYRTLTYEHERLAKQQTTVDRANARLEAEVLGWKARYTEMERRAQNEEHKVKELREDVARGRKALEGVRIAAGHESKKMQLKLDKTNAHLTKLANDPNVQARPQGLVLLNPITGGRIHPIAPTQPALLEQSVKDLAEIRQSLQEEAEAFRHVALAAGNGLREALAAREGKEEPARLHHHHFFSLPNNDPLRRSLIHQLSSSTAHPTIADARLKVLIADVRKKLTEGVPAMSSAMSNLALEDEEDDEERKRTLREQERIKMELEERVKDLEMEIVCVRAKEQEAQRLVEEMATRNAQAGSSLSSINDLSAEDELAEGLRQDKQALEEERRRFDKASLTLENEKHRFELERAAFLEERRKADVEEMLALLPSTPPSIGDLPEPSPLEQIVEDEPLAGPSSPLPRNSWQVHRPMSPSPLSPSHKLRTPKPHSASKRRVKTPLSRLVLEKAVRQKGRDTATALEMARLESSVLGEGGRRGNDARPPKSRPAPKMTLGGSVTGKSVMRGGNTLKSSVNLSASTRPSLGKPQRDLSLAEGIGPRGAAVKKTIWR